MQKGTDSSSVVRGSISRWLFAGVVSMYASAAPAEQPKPLMDLAHQNARYADPALLPGAGVFSAEDEAFLDDLTRRGIQFFVDSQDPVTGLIADRAKADGSKPGDVASIASTGFGLTAFCIAHERGWMTRDEALERSTRVMKFLRDKAPKERGHFYHFMKMSDGKREWNCEVSNIDTALLMAGVLTVRQHFPGTEAAKIADELYAAVEWGWLLQEDGTLSMGWTPEKGFIKAKWDHYSEGAPLIVLLAMGAPKHPLSPSAWQAWRRDRTHTYAGLTFLSCPPLFTHQYPWCWFDVRGLKDNFANYFENGQLATLAQRQWSMDELSKKFPTYSENFWGLTASDFKGGYTAWGGPPADGPIDGSVVPAAPAGSLAFQPRVCLDALKHMKEKYGEKAYLKYGFVDAFNPAENWYNPDVIGIDVGPSILMAENARTGFVWKTFMSSHEAQKALMAAGFRKLDAKDLMSVHTSLETPAPAEETSGRGK